MSGHRVHRELVVGLAVALAALPGAGGAQTVSGIVRDSVTAGLIPGVVVSTFDSRGTVIRRAVSDARGYSIALSPNVARIQFRRIGFAAVERQISGTESQRLDVIMRRLPVSLPPVITTGSALCDEKENRGQALALWNEARSGLLASAVARESRPARVSLARYRYVSAPGMQGAQIVERTLNPAAFRAFGAMRSPEDLAERGYLNTLPDGREFIGPDEIVLLDDSFLDTHCFGIEPRRRGDDSTFGIRFQPVRGRKVVDIEGVATLRKTPLELSSVEFRYTGLPSVEMRGKPGGWIYFDMMPTGISMVSRWSITAVGATTSPLTGIVRPDGTQRGSDGSTMLATYETGAVIESMGWDGLNPWRAVLPALSGRVKARGIETEGLIAELQNTPYVTVVDSSGSFVLPFLLPGKYSLSVHDTLLGAVGIRRGIRELIEVGRSGTTSLKELEIPSKSEVIEKACHENVPHNPPIYEMQGPGRLLGRFTFPAGKPESVPFTIVLGPPREVATAPPTTLTGMTDPSGAFRVCGYPLPRNIKVVSNGPRGKAEADISTNDRTRLISLDLKPPQ